MSLKIYKAIAFQSLKKILLKKSEVINIKLDYNKADLNNYIIEHRKKSWFKNINLEDHFKKF